MTTTASIKRMKHLQKIQKTWMKHQEGLIEIPSYDQEVQDETTLDLENQEDIDEMTLDNQEDLVEIPSENREDLDEITSDDLEEVDEIPSDIYICI